MTVHRWASYMLFWTLFSCLPSATGNDIYVVGYNDYGQLGLGDYLQRSTQTRMTGEVPRVFIITARL